MGSGATMAPRGGSTDARSFVTGCCAAASASCTTLHLGMTVTPWRPSVMWSTPPTGFTARPPSTRFCARTKPTAADTLTIVHTRHIAVSSDARRCRRRQRSPHLYRLTSGRGRRRCRALHGQRQVLLHHTARRWIAVAVVALRSTTRTRCDSRVEAGMGEWQLRERATLSRHGTLTNLNADDAGATRRVNNTLRSHSLTRCSCSVARHLWLLSDRFK
jgi:hypothetical protein